MQVDYIGIPSWAVSEGDPRTRYTVAAAVSCANIWGRWVRLSSADQRLLFGAVLFGRAAIRFTDEAVITYRTRCYGTDFERAAFSWGELADKLVN